MTGEARTEVTGLLQRWREGDEAAMQGLLPLVYEELRSLASHYLRGERPGHTMQTSDLVHEAFLRLMGAEVTSTIELTS